MFFSTLYVSINSGKTLQTKYTFHFSFGLFNQAVFVCFILGRLSRFRINLTAAVEARQYWNIGLWLWLLNLFYNDFHLSVHWQLIFEEKASVFLHSRPYWQTWNVRPFALLESNLCGEIWDIESLEHSKKEPIVTCVRHKYGYCSDHSVCKLSTGGSVVEFSPATREARVRFPASAVDFFIFLFHNFCFRTLFRNCFCKE